MNELERRLAGLGAELAFPATPDVSAAVLERIAAPRGRRVASRRMLAIAFAALVVAVAAALAVPPARTAILEFFGLRGATVQRVETLPRVPTGAEAALDLGRPVPLDDGRPRVKMPVVVVPTAPGPPDAAYVAQTLYGPKLSLVYEPRPGLPPSLFTGVGLLVTQFDATIDERYIEKLVDADTSVERLTVDGSPAVWLGGAPHVVAFRTSRGEFGEDRPRLAGNTLLVQRGPLLVRIEGVIGRERAVAIAESLAEP